VTDWFNRALAIQGWMNDRELGFLHGAALSIADGATVVEVGSWRGRSTVAICEGVSGKHGVTLYAVDTFMGNIDNDTMLERHREELAKDQIYTEFCANTGRYSFVETLRMSSQEASRQFVDGSIDWIFIDAQHTFDAVRDDIRWWYAKVKMGGLISGHDYHHFEVKRAVAGQLADVSHWESIWYVRRTRENLSPSLRPVVEVRARQALRRAPSVERRVRRLLTRVRRLLTRSAG